MAERERERACARRPLAPLSLHAAHRHAVRRVRFSPHAASLMLSCAYDMSVLLWDVAGHVAPRPQPPAPPPPLRRFNHHSEFVAAVEWSTFQERLAAITPRANPNSDPETPTLALTLRPCP